MGSRPSRPNIFRRLQKFCEENFVYNSGLPRNLQTQTLSISKENCREKGLNVTAIDISDIALDLAEKDAKEKELLNSIKFINLDIESEHANELRGPFDIIIDKLTYSFIQDKEGYLKKIYNLLSKDGFFIVMTPVLYNEFDYNDKLKNISVDKKKRISF